MSQLNQSGNNGWACRQCRFVNHPAQMICFACHQGNLEKNDSQGWQNERSVSYNNKQPRITTHQAGNPTASRGKNVMISSNGNTTGLIPAPRQSQRKITTTTPLSSASMSAGLLANPNLNQRKVITTPPPSNMADARRFSLLPEPTSASKTAGLLPHPSPKQRKVTTTAPLSNSIADSGSSLLPEPKNVRLVSNYSAIPTDDRKISMASSSTGRAQLHQPQKNFNTNINGELVLYRSEALDMRSQLIDVDLSDTEPSVRELENINRASTYLIQDLYHFFPPSSNVRVEIFGSVAMGLALAGSDVDIRVIPGTTHSKAAILSTLKRVKRMLHARHYATRLTLVPAKRVPLVRLLALGVECDVSMMNREDAWESQANIPFLRAVLRLDPRVRPLVLVAKRWAKLEGLGDASKRFLNSYGWTLLLLVFLQQARPPVLPPLRALAGGAAAVGADGALVVPPSPEGAAGGGSGLAGLRAWARARAGPGGRNTETCSALFRDFLAWDLFSCKPREYMTTEVLIDLNDATAEFSTRGGALRQAAEEKGFQSYAGKEGTRFRFVLKDPLNEQSNVARALTGASWDQICEKIHCPH